jgi:hypothetical protein
MTEVMYLCSRRVEEVWPEEEKSSQLHSSMRSLLQ